MAPRNKKTTMAKLAREHKLRERRIDKQAKKDARKQAASNSTTTQPRHRYPRRRMRSV